MFIMSCFFFSLNELFCFFCYKPAKRRSTNLKLDFETIILEINVCLFVVLLLQHKSTTVALQSERITTPTTFFFQTHTDFVLIVKSSYTHTHITTASPVHLNAALAEYFFSGSGKSKAGGSERITTLLGDFTSFLFFCCKVPLQTCHWQNRHHSVSTPTTKGHCEKLKQKRFCFVFLQSCQVSVRQQGRAAEGTSDTQHFKSQFLIYVFEVEWNQIRQRIHFNSTQICLSSYSERLRTLLYRQFSQWRLFNVHVIKNRRTN